MLRRRHRKKKESGIKHPSHRGGLAFFLSFMGLLLFVRICAPLLPLLWDSTAKLHMTRFGIGFFVGVCFAHVFVRGKLNVFIHELKHALVSGFVGNRWKGMRVGRKTGHFKFSYSQQTAEYNAFILLAPYFLPLISLPAALFFGLIWYNNHPIAVIPLGVGLGIDLLMNFRDMHPHQTDLQVIRGGYFFGVLYLFLMNATISIIFVAWVMQDFYGLKLLLFGLGDFCLQIVNAYMTKA